MIMSHQFTPYLINPHSLLRWPEPPAALQEGGIPSIGTDRVSENGEEFWEIYMMIKLNMIHNHFFPP